MDSAESQLIFLVKSALFLADELGRMDVGICLNEALVALDGIGSASMRAVPIPVEPIEKIAAIEPMAVKSRR